MHKHLLAGFIHVHHIHIVFNSKDHTNLFRDDEGTLPLEDCKRQILKNLQVLERHGYVSKKDGFQVSIFFFII